VSDVYCTLGNFQSYWRQENAMAFGGTRLAQEAIDYSNLSFEARSQMPQKPKE
jgi:hypothetical protein